MGDTTTNGDLAGRVLGNDGRMLGGERGLHLGRQTRVHGHGFGAADVDPRAIEGAFQVHAKIDHVGDQLEHRRHDLAAAGGAETEEAAIGGLDNGRAHIRQGPLAGRHRVRPARPRVEPLKKDMLLLRKKSMMAKCPYLKTFYFTGIFGSYMPYQHYSNQEHLMK